METKVTFTILSHLKSSEEIVLLLCGMQGSTPSLVHCSFVATRKARSDTQAFVGRLKESLKMYIHV